MKTLKVYQYPQCDTCRKALKFLAARGVAYESVNIVENPPSAAELAKMAKAVGEIKKLFNTSGQLYREMGLSEKVGKLSSEEAIDLLSRHGKLIKRPFVLQGNTALVGFREEEWKKVFP